MAAVTFETPRSSLDTYRSEPSKATPKHTLFGTTLEALTDGEREYINSLDLNRYTKTQTPNSNAELSARKEKYENQKLKLRKAEEDYQASQLKALNFLTTPPSSTGTKHRKPNDSQTLMELMNPDPPKQTRPVSHHRYKLMGDVFSSGREMSLLPERQPQESPRYGRRSSAKNIGFTSDFLAHYEAPKGNTNQNCGGTTNLVLVPHDKPSSIIALPPNIRHSFRSHVCDELLSDASKVRNTLERHQQERIPRKSEAIEVPTLLNPPLSQYEDLGHVTRLNLFPGLTRDQKISVTKTDYSDSVPLNRVPETDKYRMLKDEHSKWSEISSLRNKQDVKWKEYQESLPKQVANWDRNATRTIPPPKPVPVPTKKKPKPPKNKVKPNEPPSNDPEFEDFVFKTPPLTPPPMPPSPAKLPQSFQKDDDFWDFYNQEVPR